MKEYVKPTILVATLASSASIAAVNCVDTENQSDWDYIEKWDNGEFVGYVYANGSN